MSSALASTPAGLASTPNEDGGKGASAGATKNVTTEPTRNAATSGARSDPVAAPGAAKATYGDEASRGMPSGDAEIDVISRPKE